MASLALQLALMILPWRIRRACLEYLFGYTIDRTSRIGWSVIMCDTVVLRGNTRIGHLTLIKGLAQLRLEENAVIGNLNWITGMPKHATEFFQLDPDRSPELRLGEHSAITHRHLLDCTDKVDVGAFTTIAGWGTQILTHSVDVMQGRQRAAPVKVGRNCFVGTRSILLKGAALPDCSVLGAGSVLTSGEETPFSLYSGNPAKRVRALAPEAKYFNRQDGVIR